MGLAIPPYRVDVLREVDVVEEILRVYGYNQIDYSSKLHASIALVEKNDIHLVQKSVGDYLASTGFFEIMTNSLTSAKKQETVPLTNETKAVDILNPLSQDLAQLRTSMLFSGLEVIKHNNNRKWSNQRLFEFGKTYLQTTQGRKEHRHLCLWGVGKLHDDQWNSQAPGADFFALKSTCEQLLVRCRIAVTHTSIEVRYPFTECLHYYAGEELLLSLGMVEQKLTESYDIKTPVAYAELDWDQIHSMLQKEEIKFKSIPKYPSVSRDLALLVGENITFEALRNLAHSAIGNLLTEVTLFDVYSGKNIGADKKSYGLRFTLSDPEQTLTDGQIDQSMKKLLTAFEQQFNATLR
jgi:phenylalanyl-tRNA synthetase beta chain